MLPFSCQNNRNIHFQENHNFFGEKLISHFPNQKRIRKTFDQFSTGQLRPELPGKFS
jgi:hypothetical protein